MSEQLQANKASAPRSAELRHLLVRRALNEFYVPPPSEATFPTADRELLYEFAARTIGDHPITYLEFGVHRGRSIRRIAQKFRHPDARFVGFDSFEGLPEAWGPMPAGKFSTDGAPPPIADRRVGFVKGWFQNTVAEHLSAHPVAGRVLVHFDADLYSSTLFLLTTLWHHIPEYHFVFDEFIGDELIAMYDFTRAYPVEVAFLAAHVKNQNPKWPLQVFGRLRRVPFKL